MSHLVHISLWIIFGTVLILLDSNPLSACGPHFPNRLLVGGDDGILWAPQADIAIEFERIMPLIEPDPDFVCIPPPRCPDWWRIDGYQQTSVADVEDLRLAIQEENLPDEISERIIGDYVGLREALKVYVVAKSDRYWRDYPTLNTEEEWRNWYEEVVITRGDLPWGFRDMEGYPSLEEMTIPDGLPREFGLYMRGAILYYQGRWTEARERWQEVLQLPPEHRQYRSTWAAYMIGKTLLYEEPAQAKEWFQLVRELAREGYADSIGLAASSYNLEARAEILLGSYSAAIERYLDSYATGDESALVVEVRRTVFRMFETDDEALLTAAQNPTVRKLVSVNLGTSSGFSSYRDRSDRMARWLSALETVGACDIETADLLAWNAYRAGEIELAERWVELSLETGFSLWLRAKLALRDGDLVEASGLLERASREFPQDEVWWGTGSHVFPVGLDDTTTIPSRRIGAELGVVQLCMVQFPEALDSFLWGGYWIDAAYVAEQLLTPDELIVYVDESWPNPGSETDSRWTYNPRTVMAEGPEVLAWRIRYLLARRLTRIGRWQEAREYYPAEHRSTLDTYIQFIRLANDRRLSREERAELFWAAAEIARHKGMELMGTEIDPDWSVCYGNYQPRDVSEHRIDPPSSYYYAVTVELVPASEAELARIELNSWEVDPPLRYHYRYTACDHAWSSVELMPDESDETAYRLCIAGGWLKNRDPIAADVFYKAMVNRCRSTWLGQEADRIRWFPDCNSVPSVYMGEEPSDESEMVPF